jgi:tetratricopeptide (TPR) repeat protein
MVETLDKTENFRSYIRSVLRMYVYMDAGLFNSDEADALREQMVGPWYALSKEERKRMDGLVMDLNELRESRKSSEAKELNEKQQQEALVKIREVYDLKSAGKFDEALEHLRRWQSVIGPQFVWHFRGSCWNFMDVPEVAVEFYREASRLDSKNEKFAGVYLMVLKKTNFEEAKAIADRVLAEPEKHDLTLVTYAADVEVASISDVDGAEAIERSKRTAHILERVMQRLLAGEVVNHGDTVVGMAGMLLSNCYVTVGDMEQAFTLLTFLITVEPQNPLLYAARGKLKYPTTVESVKDLETSIKLGMPMSWPFVWIATYYLENGNYPACKKTCLEGLKRPLVPKIRSELLELLAIVEASSGAPETEVRDLFEQAVRTDITNYRAVENLTRFETVAHDPTRVAGWRKESQLLDRNPERVEERSFTEDLRKDLAVTP